MVFDYYYYCILFPKIGLHQDWLGDMDILLNESIQSSDKRSVEISIQRQEAMDNDIQARVSDILNKIALLLYFDNSTTQFISCNNL